MTQKTYRDFPAYSTGTGKTYQAILTEDQIEGKVCIFCPETSLRAFPCNMIGSMQLTFWLAREFFEMKKKDFF